MNSPRKEEYKFQAIDPTNHVVSDTIAVWYSDCVICGKPTVNQVRSAFGVALAFCHDTCLENLIKIHPNWFRKVTVER